MTISWEWDAEHEAHLDEKNLAPWCSGRHTPMFPGVYLRQYPIARDLYHPGTILPTGYATYFACWDGRLWRTYGFNPVAASYAEASSNEQHNAWRGIAGKPRLKLLRKKHLSTDA